MCLAALAAKLLSVRPSVWLVCVVPLHSTCCVIEHMLCQRACVCDGWLPAANKASPGCAERSDSQKMAMAAAQREAISASPGDTALVARGSAKLAAAALLRSLAKQLPRALASQLRVCALQCDGAGALCTLRTGWYHNRCYFFE